MQPERITVSQSFDSQVLDLTLNAPKGNVLDIRMITELTWALEDTAHLSSLKAVVFRGTGEHFSYGASIPEHRKEVVGDLLKQFHRFFRTLIDFRKPALAVVRGRCLGGGLELAAFCNWIFAAKDAQFGQPEIKLGVFPPVASLILPYRIGQARAEDLILTGRSLSAAEAVELGLVYSVSEQPEEKIAEFIQEHILPRSAAALQFGQQSARLEMQQAFLSKIDEIERLYLQELMQTEDATEGIEAFLQKRPPRWQNR